MFGNWQSVHVSDARWAVDGRGETFGRGVVELRTATSAEHAINIGFDVNREVMKW